jgi:hypothetical protein
MGDVADGDASSSVSAEDLESCLDAIMELEQASAQSISSRSLQQPHKLCTTHASSAAGLHSDGDARNIQG